MLTTGHALLILTLTAWGAKVSSSTQILKHMVSGKVPPEPGQRQSNIHLTSEPASQQASKQASKQASTRVSPFRPAVLLCLLFRSISFLRPYSFASGQRTTSAPSALLASPSPTRIQLASLRRPSVSVRSLPPSTPRPPTTRRPSTT
ncbi:hypothetical protein IWX48DRAFT_325873 [Phyllosticta citricarpa]